MTGKLSQQQHLTHQATTIQPHQASELPKSMAQAPSLTSHLLSLSPSSLKKATEHPFLTLAGTSSLPTPVLQRWLAQDRLYALSYINFIGSLLSQTPVPTTPDRESTIRWKVVDVLIDALENIRREVRLFEQVARESGWEETVCGKGGEREGVEAERQTRAYQDLFCGATGMGRAGVVGLVVLWGTEECYLRSWKFAKGEAASAASNAGKSQGKVADGEEEERASKRLKIDGEKGGEQEGDVMQRVFIPNWTSEEFEGFVRKLGFLVDELAKEMGLKEGDEVWRECERAWRQVLWCEAEFWPVV